MIHVPQLTRFALFLSVSLLRPEVIFGDNTVVGNMCAVNDDCQTATTIPNVISDQSYVCIAGCNLNASPDILVSSCQMGDFPTVWYQVNADANATVLNIEVHSSDFESPVISLFYGNAGCDYLEQVNLTNGNLGCIIGSHGVATAVGTTITSSYTYYIAVSSWISIGGDFEICVSTISKGSYCVISRDLQVVARSNGGPLEGPFAPAETVSICMNVNSYTAAGNGCQWFQGIVPVFGNGWDPSSFNPTGQPSYGTLNDSLFGVAGNGVYGAATWDWFNDVGYHYNNSRYRIGDFDNNGTIDMCNGVYEMNCPLQDSVTGGCCGPCWDDQGDILPPGWFAYGINGTCPNEGPPIKVDWGDGNTCGGNMGTWSFCFDLITRDTPDCLDDSTKQDLTLGFYTFADGEIGAWTGSSSVCAYDQPVKLSFKAQCGKVTTHPIHELPDLCSGGIFKYQIEEPGITTWEWNISPYWAVPFPINYGENGFTIEAPVQNQNNISQSVTGIFIGHIPGSQDVIIKKIHFDIVDCGPYTEDPLYVGNEKQTKLNPVPHGGNFSELPIVIRSGETSNENQINVYPLPANEKVYVEWYSILEQEALITIFGSYGTGVEEILVGPEDGRRKLVDIKHLSPGVYLILFTSNGHRSVSKMVKI